MHGPIVDRWNSKRDPEKPTENAVPRVALLRMLCGCLFLAVNDRGEYRTNHENSGTTPNERTLSFCRCTKTTTDKEKSRATMGRRAKKAPVSVARLMGHTDRALLAFVLYGWSAENVDTFFLPQNRNKPLTYRSVLSVVPFIPRCLSIHGSTHPSIHPSIYLFFYRYKQRNASSSLNSSSVRFVPTRM